MIKSTATHDAPGPDGIRKEVLRDKIFDLLQAWILDGTLRPGERIVEYTLAARLKVSRAPLREALWLLSKRGLVTLKAHHGTFVTALSEQDLREIFEVREVLETYAAKKIRRSLDPGKAAQLKDALKTLEQAARSRDIARFSEADLRFHETIALLAGNHHAKLMLENISSRFFGYELIRDHSHSDLFRFDLIFREHRRMVDLILTGSEQEIEQGFREILGGFLRHVLDRFANQEQHRPGQGPR
jgi:DNA-binding GntR family transcriptional regulator